MTFRARKRAATPKSRRRLFVYIGLGIVGVILLANIVMWLAYRGKVLPNVSLGAAPVGNLSYEELSHKVVFTDLLVDEIELSGPDKSEQISPLTLGVTVDWDATKENLERQRNFFPLLNLFAKRTVPVQLAVDEGIFTVEQTRMTEVFHKNTLAERVVFAGQNFEIAPPEAGYQLDQQTFKDYVLAGLQEGKRTIVVPTQVIPPNEVTGGVEEALQALRKKLQVKISFKLNGTVAQASAANIGSWFAQDGSNMKFSPEKAKEYVVGLGSIYNAGNAASAISYALDKQTDTTFVLSATQAPTKYTYCAAAKGVDQSHLPGFIAKTAVVLGDPRGWNVDGKVGFERVESGCDFSLWLSAPSQMTSFGGLCDSYYSCRSGRNVVINFDRWQGATDPWNAAGGSLEDYRVMVTNHEVGHWLGFGHRNCTGPGQPAPVMQQQSIDLQGCKFNPWPTEPELATLKQNRGIAMLPAREDYIVEDSCCCTHCVG